ncbi:MAG: glutamine-hydrolyzing carbamoyl-phosphate synthase small subunit [Pontimonas sp.]|nr:glutamine-hydrolyzing carbamoyl-phosphate synthase small subunit [Pontimonas sp.]
MTRDRAVLVLEDGSRFEGNAWGARGETLGEVVFSTGMTGYQETLTDPSYAGQIVVMTAPHIGNTGMNDEDPESRRIWVDGFVVRDPARRPSNFRSTRSLDEDLVSDGIVSISGVDTRAITLILREAGVMRGGIFSGAGIDLDSEELLDKVRTAPDMKGKNLSDQVSVNEMRVVPAVGASLGRLAVIDLGVKESTLHHLAARGFDVHVLPSSASYEDVMSLDPVALFYSNGPGDPSASDHHVSLLKSALGDRLPFFGICFGNQLLGRALGFDTYKLKYGHRGINQPVVDRTTGKVEITAQNHGFAVDAPREGVVESPAGFGKVQVSHVSLNDDVVEGLTALDIPAFSVQYHPEAAAGPHDSTYLFDRFRDLVQGEMTTTSKGGR